MDEEANNLIEEEVNKCIICMDTELENKKLYYLPCKQCNHMAIVNKKYVHQNCLETFWNQPDPGNFIAISDKICPYCQSTNLDSSQVLDIKSSILNFLGSPLSIHCLKCFLIASIVIPKKTLKYIDPITYKVGAFFLMTKLENSVFKTIISEDYFPKLSYSTQINWSNF